MSYASPEDMLARYGAEECAELGDFSVPRVVTAEMLETAVLGGDLSAYTQEEEEATQKAVTHLQDALEDAASFIEAGLGGRYQRPLTNVPRLLRRMNCDEARFTLWRETPPEHVVRSREWVLEVLRLIREGAMNLGPDANGDYPGAAKRVRFKGAERVFSPELLEDY